MRTDQDARIECLRLAVSTWNASKSAIVTTDAIIKTAKQFYEWTLSKDELTPGRGRDT
jgi:hypothetical protein